MEKRGEFRKAVLKRLPEFYKPAPCRAAPISPPPLAAAGAAASTQIRKRPGAIISRAAQEISYRRKLVETCQNGFHKLQLADAGI